MFWRFWYGVFSPGRPVDEVPVSDAELVRLNQALKRENSSLREQLVGSSHRLQT